MVDVLYSWLPSTCSSCGLLGHKASRCLLKLTRPDATSVSNILDISMDSSKLKENGKDTVGLHSIIEQSEKVSTPIIDLIKTGPVNIPITAQQPSDSRSSGPSVAPSMAIGSSSNSKGNLPSNEKVLAISNNVVLVTSKPTITREVSSPIIQVEQSIQRTFSSASLRNNMFSALESTEEEEVPMEPDTDPDHGGFLSPAGKRFLRERPVKPSAKFKDMQWNQAASGRGNRGRGNRGGRG